MKDKNKSDFCFVLFWLIDYLQLQDILTIAMFILV